MITYYFSNLHDGVIVYADSGTTFTIPNDKDNRHWQAYLAFVKEGGKTLPAIDAKPL